MIAITDHFLSWYNIVVEKKRDRVAARSPGTASRFKDGDELSDNIII